MNTHDTTHDETYTYINILYKERLAALRGSYTSTFLDPVCEIYTLKHNTTHLSDVHRVIMTTDNK